MLKPNLAAKFNPELIDFEKYQYVTDVKYDGIRALTIDGGVKSRNFKDIPNKHIQEALSIYKDLDGELIVGSPTASDVFRTTSSAVRREAGEPLFTFYVFDSLRNPELPYITYDGSPCRWDHLREVKELAALDDFSPIRLSVPKIAKSLQQIYADEAEAINFGYEGLMIRRVDQPYKFGRSTPREQGLMKLKRISSSEAVILDVEPEYENLNEATINELGYTARSSHLANRRAKEQVGRFLVMDCETKVQFYVGIFRGYTEGDTKDWWLHRELLLHRIITYDYFGVGDYDKPRHPVMKGFRDDFDFGE